MQRIAFKMKLHPGKAAEYQKRHDEIWPELQELLRSAGIRDYSIFLDEKSHDLFAVLKISQPDQLDLLPQSDIMQRWWEYMGDIMDTNADRSPQVQFLQEVFYLE